MKRAAVLTFVSILLFTAIVPAIASDLTLDITSYAMEEMEKEGYEWFVKPGTYQNI